MEHSENLSSPISVTSDLVFKYIFGSRNSTGILRSFLSEIQEHAGFRPVAEVDIRNPFSETDGEDVKQTIVDVRARDSTGTAFSVEVQSTRHAAFGRRALYYWARGYGEQIQDGDQYSRLLPVVGVNLLNFQLFPPEQQPAMHTTFTAACTANPRVPPFSDLIIHVLELPKFPDDRKRLPDGLERWLYFILNRGKERAMEDQYLNEIIEDDPQILEAEKRYQEFIADEQLRSHLRARERFRMVQAQMIHDAREEANREGRKKGLEEGQRLAQQATARAMKDAGMPESEIARFTGLSAEEIAAL